MKKKKQLISNTEAKILHEESLVIDTQQPPATTGFIFTEAMKIELVTMEKLGFSRSQAIQKLSKIAEDEIVNSESARNQYMSVWKKSGVNISFIEFIKLGAIVSIISLMIASIFLIIRINMLS